MVMTAKPWTLKTVRDRCRIDPADEDSCWIWLQATTGKARAPQACINGKTGTLVARWVLAHTGRQIDGLAVVPRCGAPLCVNPAHLMTLTKGEVLRRAYADGSRSRHAEYLRLLRRAQDTGMAKLDMERARELRDRMARGASIAELSRETGLWPSTLRDIKHGRSWRQVAAPASVFTFRPAA